MPEGLHPGAALGIEPTCTGDTVAPPLDGTSIRHTGHRAGAAARPVVYSAPVSSLVSPSIARGVMLTVVKLASSGNGPFPGPGPTAASMTVAKTIVDLIAASSDAAPEYRLTCWMRRAALTPRSREGPYIPTERAVRQMLAAESTMGGPAGGRGGARMVRNGESCAGVSSSYFFSNSAIRAFARGLSGAFSSAALKRASALSRSPRWSRSSPI